MRRSEIFLIVIVNLMLFLGLALYFERRASPQEPEPSAEAPPRAAGEAEAEETPELEPAPVPDLRALRACLEDRVLRPLEAMRDEGIRHSMVSRARPSWHGAWNCDFALTLSAAGSNAQHRLEVFARGDGSNPRALPQPVRSFAIYVRSGEIWLESVDIDAVRVPVDAWLASVRSNPWSLGVRDAELLRVLDEPLDVPR